MIGRTIADITIGDHAELERQVDQDTQRGEDVLAGEAWVIRRTPA